MEFMEYLELRTIWRPISGVHCYFPVSEVNFLHNSAIFYHQICRVIFVPGNIAHYCACKYLHVVRIVPIYNKQTHKVQQFIQ